MEKKIGLGGCSGTVVLFPFMAQGSLNPFLDLARLLSSRLPSSLTITIVSTPANILALRPRFLSYPTILFAQLSFPPHSVENTDALSTQFAVSQFYAASESLRPSFHSLISDITVSNDGKLPICIISDMFLGFTVDVAHSFGCPHVPFYTSGPYAMSIYNSLWTYFPHLNTPVIDDDDDIISLPDLPHITIRRNQLTSGMKAANPSSLFVKRQADYCKLADGSLWNTVEVLEKASLDDWQKSTGKPVWAIGPLLPTSTREYERGGKQPTVSPQMCTDWLNLQSPRSVLYVSFGSQNSIPCAQMMELAKGLELSGKPFIWVLRNPTGVDINEEFKPEWLPDRFEDRMKESKMGLLVRNWATQMEILSHRSLGAYLSHCGWNSVLESLSRGVPILGWPLGGEQHYNAKLLEEELGVCVEIGRGLDAKIDSREIAMKVNMVLDGEIGKEMKRKADALGVEMKKAVAADLEGKGSSLRDLDAFIETLLKWNEGCRRSDGSSSTG